MSDKNEKKSYIVKSNEIRNLTLEDVANSVCSGSIDSDFIVKKLEAEYEPVEPTASLSESLEKVCEIYTRVINDDAGNNNRDSKFKSVLTELKIRIKMKDH